MRAVPAPAEALVTGGGGQEPRLAERLSVACCPLALGLIALSTLVVLFSFTRSLLIPVKALVLNVLSLSATFGAMVWIFQEGHLSGLLGGVGATGYLNASMPILMFCIAFGLSMDYEVFLLSRIKEEWDRSDHSVRRQHGRGGHGPRTHRPDSYGRGRPDLDSLHCHRDFADQLHQAVRRRAWRWPSSWTPRWCAGSWSPRSCAWPVGPTGGRRDGCSLRTPSKPRFNVNGPEYELPSA